MASDGFSVRASCVVQRPSKSFVDDQKEGFGRGGEMSFENAPNGHVSIRLSAGRSMLPLKREGIDVRLHFSSATCDWLDELCQRGPKPDALPLVLNQRNAIAGGVKGVLR